MEIFNQQFNSLKAIMLDMDGVLWRGDTPIIDIGKAIHTIKSAGVKFLFMTNNSTRTIDEYVAKVAKYSPLVSQENFLTSAVATASYLSSNFPKSSEFFVIGEQGLRSAILSAGFRIGSDKPSAVVAGLERNLDYQHLSTASLLIGKGVPFIGTNPDKSFPSPEGLIPGTGAILALLEAATGVKPITIGKPGELMYKIAFERLGVGPEETLMIGDRLETDILGGQKAGCKTALVLSGVSTKAQADLWTPPPHFIADNLGVLIEEIFK